MNSMEEVTPLVSILIPVYNRESYIEACIRSAMRQTLREIEIVVVDNHSKDGTWAILELLAAEDPRIRLFRNEHNLGAVPNWRRCMEEARADIAKLLFSDDTIQPEYLEKTLPLLEDDDVGFVFTGVRIGTDAQEKDGGRVYYQTYEQDGVYASDEFVNGAFMPGDRFPVSPGCALMRVEDMKRNLRFSLPGSGITDFAEHGAGPDLLLYLLTATQYGHFAYVRELLCFFRSHPGSITINDPEHHIPRCYQATLNWFRQEVWETKNPENASEPGKIHDITAQEVGDTLAAWLEKGEADFSTGDLAGAERAFSQALEIDADNGSANNNMGVLYHQRGDYPRALSYLVRALEADSNDRHVVINAAAVLVELQQRTDALNLLSAYLSNNTNDQEARVLHDELLAGQPEPGPVQGDGVSGEPLAETALKVCQQGEACFQRGDFDGAEALFLQAIRTDRKFADGYNNLGVLWVHKGDTAKALKYLAEGLNISNSNRDLIVNTAEVLKGLGKFNDARILYSSYLERNPDDEEVFRLLSDVAGTNVNDESDAAPVVRLVDYSAGKEAPRISVVIPSFNQGEFLEQTICSILDQAYPNLELIIMDGGSTDQSVDIIKKYEGNIAYWNSGADKGQYWAVDAGLRRSTGDIMTWINSDDKLHPGSLNAIASIFTGLKDVDWVTGTPNIMDGKGELTWVCSPPPVYSRKYYLEKRYDYPRYIQQEGTFWRRSLWEKAGGGLKTSLKMAGDMELWMRFFRHTRLYTTDMLLGCFRQHCGQKTASGLELYRTEAVKELSREVTRFNSSNQTLPENAPVIMIADEAMSFRKAEEEESKIRQALRSSNGVLVTAIISTYNSEQYIRGCLEDLEAQTIADRIEIIVVDSGSEQDERAIVAEFQQRYSNIRYIRTDERETIYAAWNRAISEANGKYLTNANTDDRHLPGAYARLVSELEADPDIALVYADSAVTRIENAGFSEAPIEANFRWPDFDPRHLFSVCYIGPQPMWRRSVHEKYGYFDAEMKVAGDYDFWLRMAGTEIFRHVPEVLGLYLISASSIEHAHAGAGAAESETARQRNWPAEWGKRPELSKGYLVPVEHDITSWLDDPGMENPYISIIMPTKDRLHLLGRALDSVVAQSYRNWELIVVNDGGESIRHIVNDRNVSGRIRCIEFGWSRGQAAARNTALAEARGEVICYLDDDDIYLPDHLQTVVNEMASDGNSFIYTDAVVVKETVADGTVQEVGRSNPYAHGEYSRGRLLVNNYIPINTWAHRRSCLDTIGVFDSKLSCYEDWEFLLRLAEKYGFRHVEKTTVEVRHRVDKIDNVSRQRLGDTEQAYRDIYARHDKLLTDKLRTEREGVLGQLVRNIESWTAESEATVSESGAARDEIKDSYTAWREQHDLSDRDIARYSRRIMTEWTMQPSVHLVMTHVAGQEAALADTLDSLGAQLYGGWGLSVVSNSTCPDPVFEEMDMLEWHRVEGDLMAGVNAVVEASGADWLGLLETGSILEPHMLYQFVEYLHQHPEWRLVYTDEDRIDESGERHDPLFKPDFNLELLRAIPYMGKFILMEREALLAAGAYGQQAGAEVYDAVFQVIEQFGEQAAGHIPDVLIHRQDRFQLALDQDLVASNRRDSVTTHLKRCDIDGEAKPGTLFGSCFVDYACNDRPPLEIIVPVNGKLETLGLFLDSLFSQTEYPNFRVRLLVRDTIEIPAALCARNNIDVVSYPQSGAQWQEVLDLARNSDAEYLMLMSPGAIAIQPNWLERLVVHLQKTDVAVVAPRLVSSDKTVIGGGIITGAGSYSIGRGAFAGLGLEESGYMGRAQVAQELSAVASNCMLVRKSVFESIEGISTSLRLAFYQAVDFCLRVRESGGKIVWTPHSTLMFIGDDQSGLEGLDLDELVIRESETLCSHSLAGLANDPAYNPNLSLTGERFSADGEFTLPLTPHDHTVSRILGFTAGSIGSWKYRIQQPLNTLHREQVAHSLVLPFSKELVKWPSLVELERLQADTLLMHNTMHDTYMDTMDAYRKINKAFIVFGQDDLMFALPPKNPFSKTGYKDNKKRLRRCLGIADRVIVTTEPLAEELRSMAGDIRVVPNYLDGDIWGSLTSKRATSAKPRVGWAGAQQHLGDLELLEEVVRETAQEVDWIFFGMCPDFLQPYVKEIHNPVTFGKYPEKLATLNLDLAVAPLEYNRFNNSKSNLRILEYGVLGWPVIASDIAPYRDAPVCRVPNQPRAWIKAIHERIHDMDATRREGDSLQAWVRENWLLQQHMNDWLAALDPAGEPGLRHREQGRAAGL